jgi:uncharacterized protein YpmB
MTMILTALLRLKGLASLALNHWKLAVTIVAIIVMVCFAFYIRALRHDLEEARDEASRYARVAAENILVTAAIHAKAQEAINVLAAEKKKAADRAAVAQKRQKEILNVAKDQDGVPSPVLRSTLQRLRNLEPAAE